ncbi:phage portal protein, lambda family [Salmonella enterica subsp. arizonae]|nr:phage portal protein, lambda family [Salmonella enterica subsp. arizonae]
MSDTCFLSAIVPNWRYLGMRESAAKEFLWMRLEAAWTEYCDGIFLAKWMPRGSGLLRNSSVKAWVFHAFNGEIFLQPVWDAETTQGFPVPGSRLSVRTGGHTGVCPRKPPAFAQGWKRTGMEKPSPIMSVMTTGRWLVGSRWTRIPRFLPSGRPAMLHIFEPV